MIAPDLVVCRPSDTVGQAPGLAGIPYIAIANESVRAAAFSAPDVIWTCLPGVRLVKPLPPGTASCSRPAVHAAQ